MMPERKGDFPQSKMLGSTAVKLIPPKTMYIWLVLLTHGFHLHFCIIVFILEMDKDNADGWTIA